MDEIIMIGSARDFHAMDWYRTVKKVCNNRNILFATDLFDSESFIKLVREDDNIVNLYNIDWLLFNRQTNAGNVWRNIIKLMVSPLQVRKIKSISNCYPFGIFHAHTMYYMFLCWLANIKFIGTPQGSEVLVRPKRSFIYRYFARKALISASQVIVDSENLKKSILDLCGKDSFVVQYGIDVSSIMEMAKMKTERSGVISIRGLYPNYRIDEILLARERSRLKPQLVFCYPFWEEEYKRMIMSKLDYIDNNMGRIPSKCELYQLLLSKMLAISIPKSDSSPRSVYEAIFCGCCVAVTYSPWVDSLPFCMRSRIIIVDIEDKEWLDKAMEFAQSKTNHPFIPSQMALNKYDQENTMRTVADEFYKSRV